MESYQIIEPVFLKDDLAGSFSRWKKIRCTIAWLTFMKLPKERAETKMMTLIYMFL